jgi:WXG100 family type VII secretion target
MPGPKVRADYEALKNVAQGFSKHAEATAQTLKSLKGQMDTLHGGDWIGQGATAFYAEMNDQVLPTIQRLHLALQTSADITQKISQAMQAAEAEAAKVLRGSAANAVGAGAGAAGPPGAGAVPAPAGGPSPVAGAAAGGAAMPNVTLGETTGTAGVSAGAAGGAPAGSASGSAAGTAGGPAPAPPSPIGQAVGQPTSSHMTNALDTLDSTIESSARSQASLLDALQNIHNTLDSQSELGETESLRLQMAMDRMSKMMSTLSNLMKKVSDTSNGIVQNIK